MSDILGYILLIIGICTFILTLVLVFSQFTEKNKESFDDICKCNDDGKSNSIVGPSMVTNEFNHDEIMQTSNINNLNPNPVDNPDQVGLSQVPAQTEMQYNGAVDFSVQGIPYTPLVPKEYDLYPKKFVVPYENITGTIDDRMTKYNNQRQFVLKDAYATSYQNFDTINKEIANDITEMNEDNHQWEVVSM